LVQQQFHGTKKFGMDTMEGTKARGIIPKGTLVSSSNDFGSEFDANNRTLEASSRLNTLREISQHMPQNPHTEYNKPWYRESEQKAYLKDAKEITISFDQDEDELPSSV
jgi:hypothetical protein